MGQQAFGGSNDYRSAIIDRKLQHFYAELRTSVRALNKDSGLLHKVTDLMTEVEKSPDL